MNVVNLSDFYINQAGEVCLDKFENDIMLIFNNFSLESKKYIIDNIKNSVKDSLEIGVVFNNQLIKVVCSMYLGLAWSMHRKGKIIQKEKVVLTDISTENYKKIHMLVIKLLSDNYDYIRIIEDLSMRYYTLYFSQHIKDIFYRMNIHEHPFKDDIEGFKDTMIEFLKKFGLKILANGIIEEYNNIS